MKVDDFKKISEALSVEDIKEIINQKEILDVEADELTGLVFEFMEENDLSNKFHNFLERKNEENDYCLDINFLMLDYK